MNEANGTLRFGTPELLFEGGYISGNCCGHSYDVSPDGQRFAMIVSKIASDRRLIVELNALQALGDRH